MIGDIISCNLCGNEFIAKSHNSKFCSKACKGKSDEQKRDKRNTFSYICTECGTIINGRHKKKEENVFCNSKCRINYYNKNPKTLICKQCGKTFNGRTESSFYCSNTCKIGHKKENPLPPNHKCSNCNKEFHRDGEQKYKTIFCNRKCYSEYHAKINSSTKICEICGNEFSATNYIANKQRFCSIKCQGIWQRNTLTGKNRNNYEYTTSEYGKMKMAENMVERLVGGNLSLTDSLPQQVVNAILNKNQIEYIPEYSIKYFLIDNYIPDKKLFVEVMGNYWHCSPIKYSAIKNKMQKNNIIRDKRKHSFILNQYKCETLYIWEQDIYDSPELCEKLILEYIDKDGLLNDYNSFNYTLKNEGLVENESIIKAYFYYELKKLNSMCEYAN